MREATNDVVYGGMPSFFFAQSIKIPHLLLLKIITSVSGSIASNK